MSNTRFDGIIIGGGHNGLITAAYLAKAGVKVAVFESKLTVGGGFATEELSVPGFKHNTHAIYTKLHESPIHYDLQLDRYGVSYIYPQARHIIVKHDSYFVQHQDLEATIESISRFSKKDAAAYRKLAYQWKDWLLDFGLPELYSAPKPPDQWEDDLKKMPSGAEYVRLVKDYSPLEFAMETFETALCRDLFLRSTIMSEYEITTKGIPPFVFCNVACWLAGKTAIVRGGTRVAAEGIARVVQENGGQIFTGAPVQRIIVENGTAKGIVLNDGREFRADHFVASSIDPIHTFLYMVGDDKLPVEVQQKVAGLQFSELALFRVFLSLKERPKFKIAERDPMINDGLRYGIGFERDEDTPRMGEQVRAGRIPDITGLAAGIFSTHDPSQAPPGGCTASLSLLAPFELADGGAARWVDVANDLADKMMDKFREYAPNMTDDNVLGRFAYTPVDIETYLPSMIQGDICHGKITPEQLGFNRPFAGMSKYRTIIDKLYLCGASAHPGGFAIGAPGYNAANAIADDLGYMKWWPAFEPRKVVYI
ncbi:hypothetical protein AS156_18685 [Bradyrhizobium macuxiense]|uniref:Pyridine nucleotide-disulfide oxidoreductase domain-containing protein 2 n=1 Tax=Bradyrhizobium macuxiense TaxID=1755647 RepID=A0A109JGI3_9BRAD|nr:NAD(P)/FAD-dependent oxidoreductase [Bradyrhizobium macuxiense]KWV48498.1 hypothetical protein AS156_18685 [Bradyrhizobium macuxiense]